MNKTNRFDLTSVPKRRTRVSDAILPGIYEPLLPYVSHFYCITGSPGSGKSTMLERLITSEGGYKNLYDTILYFSQNGDTSIFSENGVPTLPPATLGHEIEAITNCGKRVLIVLDDCAAVLKNADIAQAFDTLAFNRRHICGDKGGVAIWVTAQGFVSVPLSVRKHIELLFCHKCSIADMKHAYNVMLPSVPFSEFQAILKDMWGEDRHGCVVINKYKGVIE